MRYNNGQMQIKEFEEKIVAVLKAAETEIAGPQWWGKFLGKKGLLREVSTYLRAVDDKKMAGEKLNQLKKALEAMAQEKMGAAGMDLVGGVKNAGAGPDFDWTLPALGKEKMGHLHPMTLASEKIARIFANLGFVRVRHPELDLDENAFTKLNMEANHPARDEWETFFVSGASLVGDEVKVVGEKLKKWILTPHTSNGQVHEMARQKPPIRMINIGRCYRRQQDATHTQMFHQFEGLMIDSGVSIAHLKGVLDYFAREFYGPGTKSRIRPFHFQFTEPSFEIDFSCHLCEGTGKNAAGEKCRFCKSGWHEVGGAGMVHPNVLQAAGIDADEYSGFAFGWGIERTYTLQPGLNIDDIRNFYNGNLDFLRQF